MRHTEPVKSHPRSGASLFSKSGSKVKTSSANIRVNINYLHGPAWQNVRNLPNNIKQNLSGFNMPTEVINFMHQEATEEFTFCDRIKKQEKIHKQATRKTLNYEKLFPEWWEMLNENSTMR